MNISMSNARLLVSRHVPSILVGLENIRRDNGFEYVPTNLIFNLQLEPHTFAELMNEVISKCSSEHFFLYYDYISLHDISIKYKADKMFINYVRKDIPRFLNMLLVYPLYFIKKDNVVEILMTVVSNMTSIISVFGLDAVDILYNILITNTHVITDTNDDVKMCTVAELILQTVSEVIPTNMPESQKTSIKYMLDDYRDIIIGIFRNSLEILSHNNNLTYFNKDELLCTITKRNKINKPSKKLFKGIDIYGKPITFESDTELMPGIDDISLVLELYTELFIDDLVSLFV